MFRQGRRPGAVTVAVLALVALFAVASPPARAAAATGTAELVSGDGQAVRSGQNFALLRARALGDFGPLVDVALTFVVRGSTGSTFAGGWDRSTVLTGSDGIAGASTLHAGPTAGDFTVDVQLPDGHVGASFRLTVIGDEPPAGSLRIAAGNGQQRPVGETFESLRVHATRGGAAAEGVVISFKVDDPAQTGVTVGGGGSASALTDADGLASVGLGSGAHPGAFTVTATSVLGDVVFSGAVTGTTVASLEIVSGAFQTAPVDSPFPDLLAVRVTDALGAPVAGQLVAFYAASTAIHFEGNLSTVHVLTDGAGQATAPRLFAGSRPGYATVVAAVMGMPGVLFDGLTIGQER